ncbi:MAG TPA: Gmad2 immunoglobulin-like domain-containing protein [Acidimicrobiales bacterium]|nr:Gmad2 immunoglobulin-like domain-containing protein [Acidimicrobiales bacterium]
MTIEDRLRAAIHRRTSRVEPSPDARARLEEKLMQTQTDLNRKRWLIGLAAAAAVVAIVVGVVVLTGDDGDDQVEVADTSSTTESTTSTTGSTTTTEATTTTTEGDFALVDPAPVVFPDPTTSQRFDDPDSLVAAFARDYVGMTDPAVGPFEAGDSRSGEVEVRGFPDADPTTVLVRQLEDDHWFVVGAFTESIQPATPEQGETVSSPILLTGRAYAFEGTVQVELRVDGAGTVASTFVTGRGDGVLGDYEGALEYDPQPPGTYATILYLSEGGEDFAPIYFAVTRVQLG